MKVVLVGKNSFLARLFRARTKLLDIVELSHGDVASTSFASADCVINFALDPRLMREPYDSERDIDLAIAAKLPASTRYVMMSSRMVYAADEAAGAVEHRATGLNQYGCNKLETERRLHGLLGDRLAIVRVANVLGWDAGCPRTSFLLRVIGSLRDNNRIVYDISPFVRKDFITAEYLVHAIEQACAPSCAGAFNLGSGMAIEVGHIAMWIIEGYGRGELVITSPRHVDEFWLDMTRAQEVFGSPPSLEQLRAACLTLGRTISND